MLHKVFVGFLIASWCLLSPLFAANIIRNLAQDIRARGKCRRVVVENNTVRIHFLNSDDAKIFANDLVTFINEE